jgi:hypothetical protein
MDSSKEGMGGRLGMILGLLLGSSCSPSYLILDSGAAMTRVAPVILSFLFQMRLPFKDPEWRCFVWYVLLEQTWSLCPRPTLVP